MLSERLCLHQMVYTDIFIIWHLFEDKKCLPDTETICDIIVYLIIENYL